MIGGHQHGGRKPIETSVTEFCYKSVNSSLEELKTLKYLFSYKNYQTKLNRNVSATSRNNFEIQS